MDQFSPRSPRLQQYFGLSDRLPPSPLHSPRSNALSGVRSPRLAENERQSHYTYRSFPDSPSSSEVIAALHGHQSNYMDRSHDFNVSNSLAQSDAVAAAVYNHHVRFSPDIQTAEVSRPGSTSPPLADSSNNSLGLSFGPPRLNMHDLKSALDDRLQWSDPERWHQARAASATLPATSYLTLTVDNNEVPFKKEEESPVTVGEVIDVLMVQLTDGNMPKTHAGHISLLSKLKSAFHLIGQSY
ncbi:hypothetical protein H0H92_010111 [Tricholoma furcatifolium]|nr:hypothetical protein H0H92_010111 [Tricholoma furcatifolium]